MHRRRPWPVNGSDAVFAATAAAAWVADGLAAAAGPPGAAGPALGPSAGGPVGVPGRR